VHRLCCALEPREAIRIGREEIGQDFDRDVAMELRIAGAIHLAHTTGTDGGNDLVRT
jgi:hypothetical protein